MNKEKFDAQFNEFVMASDNRFAPVVEDQVVSLNDDTAGHEDINYTYLMLCSWATRALFASRPQVHVDFGSYVYFVSLASAFVPDFRFYDIRPASIILPNLMCMAADLTNLTDIADGAFPSVSCMHVIEHIGLGRYGDAIDPDGDLKAASELARVLAPGGELLFVAPLNQRPRVRFNSHRHYSYEMATSMFVGLELKEFSLVGPYGIIYGADPARILKSSGNVDSTGCFRFRKPGELPVASEPSQQSATPEMVTIRMLGSGEKKKLPVKTARQLVDKKAAKYE